MSRENTSDRRPRLPGPDIVRGFAAIGIVLFHLCYLSGMKIDKTAFAIFNTFGSFVPLFFAISGFFISYAYMERLNSRRDQSLYYAKRFFRLAPLFYIMLALEAGLTYALGGSAPSFHDVLLSLTFAFPFVPGKHESLVMAGWAVGIEWIFYVLAPALICLITTKPRAIVAYLVALYLGMQTGRLALHATPVLKSYYYMNIVNHLVFFMSGIVVFHFLRTINNLRDSLETRVRSSVASGVLLAAVIVSLTLYHSLRLSPIIDYHLAYSLAWIAVLVAAILGMPRLLNNAFTEFLGRSSYSIYLIHPVVIVCLKKATFYRHVEHAIHTPSIALAIAALVTIGIVLIGAWISYRYVEEWVMNQALRILKAKLNTNSA